jgi:hypothetical protein
MIADLRRPNAVAAEVVNFVKPYNAKIARKVIRRGSSYDKAEALFSPLAVTHTRASIMRNRASFFLFML